MSGDDLSLVTEGVVRHTALADAYSLLAYLLQPPTKETAEQLVATSIGDDVRQIAVEAGLEGDLAAIADQFDRAHAQLAASDDALGQVRREYTRVFTHPTNPLILLYEGVFTDVERVAVGLESTHAVLFVNPTAADAERRYKAVGFETNTYRVPADCITVELEFMGILHENMARALLENDAVAAGRFGEALDTFIETHIVKWVPRFFARCEEECAHELYRAAGSFGAAVVSADSA